MPPVGAAALIVTVPVEFLPPATVEGLSVKEVRTGGLIVRLAVTVVPFRLAEIVAVELVPTGEVFTMKIPIVLPAGTVTVAGGIAALKLLESFTTMPPAGAGPVSVTVPEEVEPPVNVVGVNTIELNTGGFTVRVAL